MVSVMPIDGTDKSVDHENTGATIATKILGPPNNFLELPWQQW